VTIAHRFRHPTGGSGRAEANSTHNPTRPGLAPAARVRHSGGFPTSFSLGRVRDGELTSSDNRLNSRLNPHNAVG